MMVINRSTPPASATLNRSPANNADAQDKIMDSDSKATSDEPFGQLLPGTQALVQLPEGEAQSAEDAPADEQAQVDAAPVVADVAMPPLPPSQPEIDAVAPVSPPAGNQTAPALDAILAARLTPAALLSRTTLAAEPAAAPAAAPLVENSVQPAADAIIPPAADHRTVSSALLSLGAPLLHDSTATASAQVEWAPLPLVPQAEGGKPQALQQLLAERLAVQSSHWMDRALIRLDPPRFGALEIALQHEGGRLTVQLTASHGEVVRQLQGIGDFLRQELGQRQFQSVQVDIRHGMQDGQQQGSRQQQQEQAAPGRALQLEEEGRFGESYAREEQQA